MRTPDAEGYIRSDNITFIWFWQTFVMLDIFVD